jgi:hypothetical protein
MSRPARRQEQRSGPHNGDRLDRHDRHRQRDVAGAHASADGQHHQIGRDRYRNACFHRHEQGDARHRADACRFAGRDAQPGRRLGYHHGKNPRWERMVPAWAALRSVSVTISRTRCCTLITSTASR